MLRVFKHNRYEISIVLLFLVIIISNVLFLTTTNIYYRIDNERQKRGIEKQFPPGKLSLRVSIVLGVLTNLFWLTSARFRKKFLQFLLSNDLGHLSIKNAELIVTIMEKEEFTIPELLKSSNTNLSRDSILRLLQKLEKHGLIEETDSKKEKKGRGRNPQIYKYKGKLKLK